MLVQVVAIFAAVIGVCGATLQPQIPSVASFAPSSGSESFQLSDGILIVVDSEVVTKGSPSLLNFAKTFRDDLSSVADFKLVPPVQTGSQSSILTKLLPSIFFTIDTTKNYKLYNGKSTEEGYDLITAHNSITIIAAAPIGAWWASRTLLQQVALAIKSGSRRISLPLGHITDSPGWEVRGFMLDAGRHWFETDFLS